MKYKNTQSASALVCAGLLLLSAATATAVNAQGKPITPTPAEWGDTREHDARSFTPLISPLPALAGFPDTERFVGVNDGASYQIEVPTNWNGMLVLSLIHI